MVLKNVNKKQTFLFTKQLRFQVFWNRETA